ncbi:hypothetical protein BIW11_08665, partial [Tropilaelaps mercedesae]
MAASFYKLIRLNDACGHHFMSAVNSNARAHARSKIHTCSVVRFFPLKRPQWRRPAHSQMSGNGSVCTCGHLKCAESREDKMDGGAVWIPTTMASVVKTTVRMFQTQIRQILILTALAMFVITVRSPPILTKKILREEGSATPVWAEATTADQDAVILAYYFRNVQ